MKTYISFLFALCLMSCSGPAPKKDPLAPKQLAGQHETTAAPGTADREEGVFERYDKVEQIVSRWNMLIDDHRAEKLSGVYADEVMYYLHPQTQQECIANKVKYLAAHTGYRQEIDHLEVYYFEEDTLGKMLVAEFDKICTDKGKKTTVPSLLYCARFNGQWKIVQETDRATELNRAKRTRGSGLANGTCTFYRGYWMDTRSIPQFAHDQVPYRFTIQLNVTDNGITGAYAIYSGTMRSTMEYLVVAGKTTDGILDLTVVYNPDGLTPEEYAAEADPAKEEHLHFRIIRGDELVGLDPDEGYLCGKSLFLQ